MRFRMMTVAGLALALAGCTTTGGAGSGNAVDAKWLGKPAGGFFAAYGPPVSDVESGSSTVYSWKGGYKTRRIPAEYAKTTDGKRGKQTAPARTVYLSCSVQITTDADYIIRSIRILGDRKTDSGPSYCEEFLGDAKAE
ncbi:hypothetical protein [Rhizobium sp. SG2393]|uniref:hypothetical protein n=1 Tax=Rhizobium sp. SG2393 TaxID=3276279 RepID=UPI00367288D3